MSKPPIPKLPTLRVGRVHVPWAEPAPVPAPAVPDLSALWRTASEVEATTAEPDLSAMWMAEIAAVESGPTNVDFDFEFSADYEPPRHTAARFRVDRPPTPTAPRMTVQQVREAARAVRENAREARDAFTEAARLTPPPPAPVAKTPMQRAAEYAARPTVYDRLLNDD